MDDDDNDDDWMNIMWLHSTKKNQLICNENQNKTRNLFGFFYCKWIFDDDDDG